LLAFLEKTKAENSRGLEFEIEANGDPEESYTPEKYIQEYDVSIRYEGVELGGCPLVSEGACFLGKWVAESAQWPTLLEGLIPLPTVAIRELDRQDRRLALFDRVAWTLDRMGRISVNNVARHQPVEEHPNRGQVLLRGSAINREFHACSQLAD
jgi:hypothetical protein